MTECIHVTLCKIMYNFKIIIQLPTICIKSKPQWVNYKDNQK